MTEKFPPDFPTHTMKKVWIYTNTSKQAGDPEHLKVFGTEEDANAWFRANDPEGVAFAYPVMQKEPDPI